MKINDIFANFLASDNLVCDNQAIATYVKQNYNTNEPVSIIKDDSFVDMIKIVEEKLNDIYNHIQMSEKFSLDVCDAWVNISHHDAISNPHNHPRSILSAVYYVSISEHGGDLVFMNPNDQVSQVIPSQKDNNIVNTFNKYNSSSWVIKPKVGELYIFPSWLYHYVTRGDGTERISLAFNTNIK